MAVKFKRQFRGYRPDEVEAYQGRLVESFSRELEELRQELDRERAKTQRMARALAAREAELRDAAVRGTQSLRQALQRPYDSVQTLQDVMGQQVKRRQELQADLERRRTALASVRRLQAQLAGSLRQTAAQYMEALATEQTAWQSAGHIGWEQAAQAAWEAAGAMTRNAPTRAVSGKAADQTTQGEAE